MNMNTQEVYVVFIDNSTVQMYTVFRQQFQQLSSYYCTMKTNQISALLTK